MAPALNALESTVPVKDGKVSWRHIMLFTVLAYALTWAWDGIWIIPKLGTLLTTPTTPSDPTAVFGNVLAHLPAMFGPLIAALIMRLWISREGFRGSLRIRRPWRHYAIAVLGPLAFLAAIGLVFALAGIARFSMPAEPLTLLIIAIFIVLLLAEIILGFGEEYGWRGYLLPQLLPLGEIRATLILGVIWSLWHFPVVLAGVILGGHSLWVVIPVHAFLIMAGTFPYTWLGKLTGHSPTVAAVFHGTLNWGQQRLITFLIISDLATGSVVMGVGWLAVAACAYGVDRYRAQPPYACRRASITRAASRSEIQNSFRAPSGLFVRDPV